MNQTSPLRTTCHVEVQHGYLFVCHLFGLIAPRCAFVIDDVGHVGIA